MDKEKKNLKSFYGVFFLVAEDPKPKVGWLAGSRSFGFRAFHGAAHIDWRARVERKGNPAPPASFYIYAVVSLAHALLHAPWTWKKKNLGTLR